MKYDNEQIAKKLTKTALGDGYYGNALYVAKDIPGLTGDERWVVLRYLHGVQKVSDQLALQDIANKISKMENQA